MKKWQEEKNRKNEDLEKRWAYSFHTLLTTLRWVAFLLGLLKNVQTFILVSLEADESTKQELDMFFLLTL